MEVGEGMRKLRKISVLLALLILVTSVTIIPAEAASGVKASVNVKTLNIRKKASTSSIWQEQEKSRRTVCCTTAPALSRESLATARPRTAF